MDKNIIYFPTFVLEIYNKGNKKRISNYFPHIEIIVLFLKKHISNGNVSIYDRNHVKFGDLEFMGMFVLNYCKDVVLDRDITEKFSSYGDLCILGGDLFYNIETGKYTIKGVEKDLVESVNEYSNVSSESFGLLMFIYLALKEEEFINGLDKFIDKNKYNEDIIVVKNIKSYQDSDGFILGSLFVNHPIIYSRICEILGLSSDVEEHNYSVLNSEFYFIYLRIMNGSKSYSLPPDIYKYVGLVFEYFGRVAFSRNNKYIKYKDAIKLMEDKDLKYTNYGEDDLDIIKFIDSSNISSLDFLELNKLDNIYYFIENIMDGMNIFFYCINLIISGEITVEELLDIFCLKYRGKNHMIYLLKSIKELSISRICIYDIRDRFTKDVIEEILIKNYYSDKELEERYKIITPSNNRKNKREEISGVIFGGIQSENKLFIPLGKRNSIIKLDNDGFNPNSEEECKYVFALGTNINNYSCYEISSVHKLMDTRKNYYYNYIGNIFIKFNKYLVKNFVKLIKKSDYPEKEQFIKLLKEIEEDKKNTWRIIFNNLTVEEKKILKNFFLGTFVLGMIIRRWIPGKDAHYPMKEVGTRHGDRDISEDEMSLILTESFTMFKNQVLSKLTDNIIKLLNKLKCMTKIDGVIEEEYINSSGKILLLIEKTFEKESEEEAACQRTSSNCLIANADYYLKLLFDHKINAFDIDELETIA